ncbi:MAG: tetratricopeptide repeat protein, partial [Mycobacteriales bacterium]
LVDDDPATAYEHAKRAKARAARLGVVREALGITAYHAGDYAIALAELRAARRITGAPDHLALIADCERGLGRPERALAVADDPGVARLDPGARAELAIVVSGARRDLGQPDAAVAVLERHGVDGDDVTAWTPRLWYAYADALLAAGRRDEAREWFAAVLGVDEDETTDAAERLAALGG